MFSSIVEYAKVNACCREELNHKMINNWHTPLLSHLVTFAKHQPRSFHVPGHANGLIYHALEEILNSHGETQYIKSLADIAQLDTTELSHTDDLHAPDGVIAEAENLTATLYGADQSYFLVGGSTAGNIALILSICEYGDYIIVQRNVHKSIINGCKLAGARVIFVAPQIEPVTRLPVVPSIDTLQQALNQYPQAKAVFVTNPNYYGISTSMQPYVELVHQYEMPIFVDEAHGAHYGIAPYAPASALAAGADAVVQSAHKTLPALTMGAFLHIQGSYMNKQAVRQQLAIVQSSSPSYIIMSSLDVARATLQHFGEKWFMKSYELLQQFRDWLRQEQLPIDTISLPKVSEYIQDPYRLLLTDKSERLSGYELQSELEKHHIWVEMANDQVAVLVCHMNLQHEVLEQLKRAILDVCTVIYTKGAAKITTPSASVQQLPVSDPIQLLRNVSSSMLESVTIERAEGRLCAEMVIPYPPGIPLLYEGEVIQASHIAIIQQYRLLGARFQGSDALLEGFIQVFKAESYNS